MNKKVYIGRISDYMVMGYEIKRIIAREVLDSRGNPTIEVSVATSKSVGTAIVPSGASTGKYEALELRDNDKKRYFGKGVKKAVNNVNSVLNNKLKDMDVTNQRLLDQTMIELDATANKSKLGANAILGVSMAAARASAMEQEKHLFEVLGKETNLPVPFCNIINGGMHAGNSLDIQEFMIVPVKAKNFGQATQMVSETYHVLKEVIKQKYGKPATNVGDEGGFAPPIQTAEESLDLITQAIKTAGYHKAIKIALDVAASELLDEKTKKYRMNNKMYTSPELIDYYAGLIKKYDLISIEDPFDQDDLEAWKELTKKNSKTQIVGDDLLVTNTERIRMAAEKKLCNALLLKVNQIGTVTQSIDAANLAFKNKWGVMVSHRSGETEDPFISDLAVGLGCGMIKIGAPCRSDRVSKYNQLLRIEEVLGVKIRYGK